MHSIKDLRNAVHAEIIRTKQSDVKLLAVVGALIQREARNQIGHYQDNWATTQWGPRGKLSPDTIREKIKRGFSPQGGMAADAPLYDTGEYKSSIKVKIDPALNVVHIGSDLEYAKYLEYGTSRMIPRPIFGAKPLMKLQADLPMIVEKLYLKKLR